MATTLSSDGGMSSRMQIYYDRLMLMQLLPDLYFYQFAEKRPLPRNSGKTVYFGRYALPTATITTLTEGTAPSAAALSSNVVSALLEQLGYVYGVSDLLELTAVQPQVEQAIRQLAIKAKTDVDAYIRNAIIDGASVNIEFVSASGTKGAISALYSNDTLTGSVVRKAALRLARLNVPRFPGGYYIWLTHPLASEQLRSDTATGGWVDVTKYVETGAEQIWNGEIGKLHGFKFIETTQVYTGSAAATSVVSVSGVYNVAFGQGFYGVTEVDGGIQTFVKTANPYDKSDPLNQFSTVGYKLTFTSKVLNTSAGVVVPTAVTFI